MSPSESSLSTSESSSSSESETVVARHAIMAREKTSATDHIAESSPALVIQQQIARERPSSPPIPWLSSGSPPCTLPSHQTTEEVAGRVLDSLR